MTTFTYYYVQAKTKGDFPQIIYHTYDEKRNEYFYKFLDKKKAQDLADSEKKTNPNENFRIVKLIEKYIAGEWI